MQQLQNLCIEHAKQCIEVIAEEGGWLNTNTKRSPNKWHTLQAPPRASETEETLRTCACLRCPSFLVISPVWGLELASGVSPSFPLSLSLSLSREETHGTCVSHYASSLVHDQAHYQTLTASALYM